ncbi:MAG TPA: alpha/beta hydrolase family protein [Kofleriaceae bacterium]
MLERGGARLWSISTGAGLPVILLNGGPGCDDYLGPVASLIDDTCQVVRFEPRGCGRSSSDKQYDLQTTIEDVEHVRDAYGFDRFIAIGHSAGVDTALAYALAYPGRVQHLIGLAGGRIVNDREWSRVYKENLAARGEDAGTVFNADPDVNAIGVASWRQYITRPTLLAELASLMTTATFIYPSEDIRPSWPTQQLANLLPRGLYREIAGAAHYLWRTHAAQLQAALRAAIERGED